MRSFIKIFQANEILSNTQKNKTILEGESSLTYKNLYILIYHVIYLFKKNNIKKGDCTLILTDNYIDTSIIYFACLRAGVIPLFFHEQSPNRTILEIMNLVNCKGFFIKNSYYEKIKDIIPKDIKIWILDQQPSFIKKYFFSSNISFLKLG